MSMLAKETAARVGRPVCYRDLVPGDVIIKNRCLSWLIIAVRDDLGKMNKKTFRSVFHDSMAGATSIVSFTQHDTDVVSHTVLSPHAEAR